MTARARFKQSDVTSAMKAAVKAGMPPRECVIGPDGAIRLLFGDDAGTSATNPLDRLLSR